MLKSVLATSALLIVGAYGHDVAYGVCSIYEDCVESCEASDMDCIGSCISENRDRCIAGVSLPDDAPDHFVKSVDIWCNSIAGGRSYSCINEKTNCLDNDSTMEVCDKGFGECQDCICEFSTCMSNVEEKNDIYECIDRFNFCKDPEVDMISDVCDSERCLQGCSSIEDPARREDCAIGCDGHYNGNCAACDTEDDVCRENGNLELCDTKKAACIDCMVEFEVCTGDESRTIGACFEGYGLCKGGESHDSNGQDYTPAEYSAIEGCYRDQASRVLPDAYMRSASMTTQVCADFCKSKGFEIFGTEWYEECFCGDNKSAQPYVNIDVTECNAPCGGNGEEICGGGWALSLYRINSESESQFFAVVAGTAAATGVVMGLGFTLYARKLKTNKTGEVAVLSDSA